MQTRKCHADADANANAGANRIRTENNMSPSPSVGDVIIHLQLMIFQKTTFVKAWNMISFDWFYYMSHVMTKLLP